MFNKAQSYVGIDIGSTSVKMVELKKLNNNPTLVNYGYTDEINDFSGKSTAIDPSKVAKIITELRKKTGIHAINAVAAMPSFSVFSSVLSLSVINSKKENIEAAVMWEAKKVVPLALEEMILDWKIISDLETEAIAGHGGEDNGVNSSDNSVKVLLTGAPKTLVKKYIDIFKRSKLVLISLETEMFSLIRSLVGSDPSVIAVVDLGAVNTDIAIIENGLPMFIRSLDAGGIMITKAVSDSLKVGFKRAEQFKFDLSAAAPPNQEPPKIIADTISNIINEIRYSLNLFQQENNKKIEKIILSGGGANLVNIAAYLSNIMDMNVLIGDPWARISYPVDLKPVLDDIGPKMAIAVGLALRETV